MHVTKDQAYEKVARLIERFSEHVEEYKRNNPFAPSEGATDSINSISI